MARPTALSESSKVRAVALRRKKIPHWQIAETLGVSTNTIGRFFRGQDAQSRMRGMPSTVAQNGPAAMEAWEDTNPPPKTYGELSPRAKRALVDFPYFCEHILGEPLQAHQLGWDRIEEGEIQASNRFIQINVHPRGGKTDWRTNKKALWRLIGGGRAREFYEQFDPPLRDLRLVLVAGSESQSDKNCEYIQSRLAEHARLIGEYGRFKQPGLAWRPSQGVLTIAGRRRLELAGDYSLVCVGMRSHFLGRGGDEIVADDAFDLENCATPEAAEKCLHWLRTQVFSRLEPGGSISVLGARLPMPNDPYIQIAKWPAAVEGVFGEEEMEVPEDDDYPRLFHTIVQPAVLDWERRIVLCPERFTWRQLMQAKALAGADVWNSTWMQRPSEGASTLARREWIYGGAGIDPTSRLTREFPGCMDPDRRFGETTPIKVLRDHREELAPSIRVVSVDPSDVKWWSILCADLYKTGSGEFRPVLVDLDRNKHNTGSFLAVLGQFWDLHHFSVVLLEKNMAKFLLENEAFLDFCRQRGIKILRHFTGDNRNHPRWGVGTLRDDFLEGRIRIPNADYETRAKFSYLVKEALGELATDDVLMSLWFLKFNLAGLLALASSGSNWPGWTGSPGRHKAPPARVGKYWAGAAR
jgi:hypothetical protein